MITGCGIVRLKYGSRDDGLDSAGGRCIMYCVASSKIKVIRLD